MGTTSTLPVAERDLETGGEVVAPGCILDGADEVVPAMEPLQHASLGGVSVDEEGDGGRAVKGVCMCHVGCVSSGGPTWGRGACQKHDCRCTVHNTGALPKPTRRTLVQHACRALLGAVLTRPAGVRAARAALPLGSRQPSLP